MKSAPISARGSGRASSRRRDRKQWLHDDDVATSRERPRRRRPRFLSFSSTPTGVARLLPAHARTPACTLRARSFISLVSLSISLPPSLIVIIIMPPRSEKNTEIKNEKK